MSDRFPVTYSTLSAEALAAEVLPDYGLGSIADCKFYSGGFNDTYIVRTAQGDTYYLRVYRLRWRSRADVGYELDALNHLYRKGVPVARPLPCGDGTFVRELLAPEGRRYVVLFVEAEGEEPSYDRDAEGKAFDYGQAVARLHNAVEDLSSSYQRFHLNLDHLIDTPLRNIEPVLSRRVEDWTYVQRFAAMVRQRIVDLPADALEQGFCHGDLQGYHHRIADNGMMTFIDFDCCGYGYRAYDLAVFRWCGRLEEQELVWWRPYLRGYREVRPLNDLDVKAVPLFVCARHIWHMGVHAENACDWGFGALGDAYFGRRVGWLRALEVDYLDGEEPGTREPCARA
jgi:Ser/Thr protein kinase RdoA (MazF antagonist)